MQTEEAATANKCSEDALYKQQTLTDEWKMTWGAGVGDAAALVNSWLGNKVEVVISTEETKHHLNDLLEHRKTLA